MGAHSTPGEEDGLVTEELPAVRRGLIALPSGDPLPADEPAPDVPVHDGASGSVLARTEPKVRAAALAALLTPLVLVYAGHYLPPVVAGSPQLSGLLSGLLTGLLTGLIAWAAGWAGKAVHRIDKAGIDLSALTDAVEKAIDEGAAGG